MDNNVKVVLASAATALVTILATTALGFGKKQAQNVYMTDGTNVQELISAVNTKLDSVTGVLSEAITSGTKKIRTDILDRAKDAYRQEEARIKAEAAAAKKQAAEARAAVRHDPGATLFATSVSPN